jgi:hypothetical protein
MQEAKDPESTETAGGEEGTEAREPDSTATSSDTLSDIEQAEKVSTTTGGGSESTTGNNASDAPSPDGQFDGSSRGDGGDAGPM